MADKSTNNETSATVNDDQYPNNYIPIKKPGFTLTFNIITIILIVSTGYLLTVCLISGLVFRDINTCKSKSNAASQIITTTTTTTMTITQSTILPTTSPTTLATSSTSTPLITTPSTTPSTNPTTKTNPTIPTTTTTPTTTLSSSTAQLTTVTPTTTVSTSTVSLTDRTVTLTSQSTTTTGAPTGNIYENLRLPDIYELTNYNLKIHFFYSPDLKNVDGTKFNGEIDMFFNLKKDTKEILFHVDPQIQVVDTIVIINLDTFSQILIKDEIHKPVINEYYYINTNKTLAAGKYVISVPFVSQYQSLYENRGVFALRYLDDYIEKTMIATSFSPNEARKGFPCFDEPELKATFDITIRHPLKSYVLSNAQELSKTYKSDSNGEYYETIFKTTPRMSTSSVGWVIVPDSVTFVEATSASGVPIRVYGKQFAKNKGLLDHALNVAKGSLDFFQRDYLVNNDGVLSKIDLISIPDYPYETSDGSWGISMFRETSILYSKTKDSSLTKQTTALAIAQKIAELWFGNLVSCNWWNEYWFNKASSSFLKYKAVNSLFPDWDIINQITIEETIQNMWDDGYSSSHPLAVKVATRAEIISSAFDQITSRKGASIMRMVESVVGVSQVQNGFKNYLNRNKFSVGVIADFYSAFILPAEMSSTTPERFLLSWVAQMNYPVVEVQLVRQGLDTVFNFEQDRFLLSIYDEENNPIYTSPYGYTWQIFIKCKAGGIFNDTGDESQHLQGSIDEVNLFLATTRASLLRSGRSYTWIKCNPNFESYYTTEYSKNIYDSFIGALDIAHNAVFSVGDRANLLHNTFQLAYRGDFRYSTPASLVSYMAYREKDYLPWKTFMYHVNLIANLLEHRPVFKTLAIFADSIVESLAFTYDLYQESSVSKPHLTYLLESSAVEFLCRLQDENCLNKISDIFDKIPEISFNDPNIANITVSPNIRASVYKYHLQNTYDYYDWFDIYQSYELTGDAQEKNDALSALTATRSVWLLNLLFDDVLNRDRNVKKQDIFPIINQISKNPSGRHTSWYFYRHYWDTLVFTFGIDDYELGQCIKIICETFENSYFLQELYEFYASRPYSGSGIFARIQALDVIANNIFWIFDREDDVSNNLLGPL